MCVCEGAVYDFIYCSQLIQAFHTYLPIVKAHKLSPKHHHFNFKSLTFLWSNAILWNLGSIP